MSREKIQIELKTNALTVAEALEMWTLYEPYYYYSFEDFFRRVTANTHYALYRQAGKLVGFTGLRIEKINLLGKRYLTIYFGQTLVASGVRGKGLINRTGLRVLRRFWQDMLTHQIVFWADTLSYRAYLVFAKNLEDYYPNHRNVLPEDMRMLRDFLGRKYYGERYCPQSGTIQKDLNLVRDNTTMVISAHEQQDADVDCFVRANPNYAQGTGLLTLGPGHWRNIQSIFKKFRAKQRDLRTTTRPERKELMLKAAV
ncbi:MAG: hypothetical protein D6772_13955 [Bacteroidetes bacterium]|nr:MAG: hypothetical protein D6772_13955 [Bacteroidota bacterium]